MFSVRVDDKNVTHTRVTVFNNGANAGTLTIATDDVEEFIKRLSGATCITQTANVVSGTMIGATIGSLK